MDVKIEDGYIVIRAKIDEPPKPSASGKSLVLSSTRGNINTGVEWDGKPIVIGFNAYVKR